MKATSVHVALLAVFVYGVSSVAYLYGQANGRPASAPPAAAAPPSAAPIAPTPSVSSGEYGFTGNPNPESPPEYRTIRIEHADASVLAKQLKDLVPYSTVLGDARTNQIIIHGPKEVIETILSLIKQLDVPDAENVPGAKNSGFTFGFAKPATPMGPPTASATIGARLPSWRKASEEYSDWAAGDEKEIQQTVLRMLQMLNDHQASPSADGVQELKGRIDHLLSEQARRANEEAQRADEKAQLANQQAQKARALSDDEQRLAAEQARRAADDARRTAEQARRTIEQLQRALQTPPGNEHASDDARWAMEVDQRIAALSLTIRQLEAAGNPTDKQKAELDNAKQQLKEHLATQFDEHQKQESEELKQLRERLDKLEKEISDRAQHRDDLINRRLDDVISGKTAQSISDQQGAMVISAPNLTIRAAPAIDAGPAISVGPIRYQTSPGGTVTISGPGGIMTSSAPPPGSKTDATSSSDLVAPPQPPKAPVAPDKLESSDANPAPSH
jgi:hypothetical protein